MTEFKLNVWYESNEQCRIGIVKEDEFNFLVMVRDEHNKKNFKFFESEWDAFRWLNDFLGDSYFEVLFFNNRGYQERTMI